MEHYIVLDAGIDFTAAFLACLLALFIFQRGWRVFRRIGTGLEPVITSAGEMRCNHCGQTRLVSPCRHGHICADCNKLGKD